ncbi:hypothetical protein GE061_005678 [Apolygus lucorum]|uniref:Uncharacterized protein n=1 Tax=Apolygus lucorum TaxID=248454 RepID=A0A8S9WYQ6_APOLU|nr:hypothetical protein GE061_005678 [Apolygus lucorum]
MVWGIMRCIRQLGKGDPVEESRVKELMKERGWTNRDEDISRWVEAGVYLGAIVRTSRGLQVPTKLARFMASCTDSVRGSCSRDLPVWKWVKKDCCSCLSSLKPSRKNSTRKGESTIRPTVNRLRGDLYRILLMKRQLKFERSKSKPNAGTTSSRENVKTRRESENGKEHDQKRETVQSRCTKQTEETEITEGHNFLREWYEEWKPDVKKVHSETRSYLVTDEDGQEYRVSLEYVRQYLGVTLSSSGQFKVQAKQAISKSKMAMGCTREIFWRGRVVSWDAKTKHFETMIESVLLYAAERTCDSALNPLYRRIVEYGGRQHYLGIYRNIHVERLLAQMRLASKDITRFYHKTVAYTIDGTMPCMHCNMRAVKNAIHWVLLCPLYEPYRRHYLSFYIKPGKPLGSMSTSELELVLCDILDVGEDNAKAFAVPISDAQFRGPISDAACLLCK